MENQHRKISNYRELNQEEIDLMNRIKKTGNELMALQQEVVARLLKEQSSNAVLSAGKTAEQRMEIRRFMAADPLRWAAIAQTDIQTGVMALVRSVAQPAGV